jgi:hypothetical protein
MAKIQEFISEVKTQGLARTNRFIVELSAPAVAQQSVVKKALLFCDTAQLPGISYATTQNRTFGEFREIPYDKLYEPITLTFFVDRDMHVKSLFDNWIHQIQNPSTHTFEYYNRYTTQMKIEVQDLNDKSKYVVDLYECYPKSVGAVQLSAESKDIMKMTVNFQYKYWTSSNLQQLANGQKLTSASLNSYNREYSGFQARLNKGLGEAGNFLTGAVGQYAMRSFSHFTSRIPAIKF